MRIHIGGIDDAGYVDVVAAQGFRHGTPLIHGSDHFDGSVFFDDDRPLPHAATDASIPTEASAAIAILTIRYMIDPP